MKIFGEYINYILWKNCANKTNICGADPPAISQQADPLKTKTNARDIWTKIKRK